MSDTEKDPKSRLFERLDRYLVWNVSTFGRNTGRDVDAVYALESQIEWHRYLKTEHNFAPGEVEALLDFQDPLSVTQICWMENRFESGFPICDILDDINAYERFDLTWEAQRKRFEPQVQQLKERLDKNYADYTVTLLGKSKQELIEGSKAIATTQAVYSYMKNIYEYQSEQADSLLDLDDPLRYIAAHWPDVFDDIDDDGIIRGAILKLKDQENLRCAQKATAIDHRQSEKPSIQGQLRKAIQETKQHLSPEKKFQRQSDTKNR